MKKRKIAAELANFPFTNAGPRGLPDVKTPEQEEAERVAREEQIMNALNMQLGDVETELKNPFNAAPKFAVEVSDINGRMDSNVITEFTPQLLDAPKKVD